MRRVSKSMAVAALVVAATTSPAIAQNTVGGTPDAAPTAQQQNDDGFPWGLLGLLGLAGLLGLKRNDRDDHHRTSTGTTDRR
jgi:hypothetical protein